MVPWPFNHPNHFIDKEGLPVTDFMTILISELKTAGYPFVRIRLSALERILESTSGDGQDPNPVRLEVGDKLLANVLENGRFLYEFSVEPLAITSTDHIKFEGNTRYSDTFLKRFIRPALCEKLSSCEHRLTREEDVEKVLQRLHRLEGLDSAELSGWSFADTSSSYPTVASVFQLTEKTTTRLDGVLGISSVQGSTSLMGNVHLSVPAISGNGLSVEASFSRLKPLQTRSHVEFRKQMVSTIPVDVSLNYSFYQEDSLYLESIMSSALNWNASLQWSGGTRLTLRNVRYGDGSDRDHRNDKTHVYMGYTVNFHPNGINPQSFILPINGFSSSIIFEHALVSERQVRADLFLRYAHTWAPEKWFIFLQGRAQIVHQKDLAYSELIQVGGPGDLPGLNPSQFRARRRLQTDAQLRWLANSDLWFHIFSTSALLSIYDRNTGLNNEEIASNLPRTFSEKWILSTGVGLTLKTRSGWLTIESAWSSADRFRQGRIILKWTP